MFSIGKRGRSIKKLVVGRQAGKVDVASGEEDLVLHE